jgi:hypothetical protein
MKTVFWKTVFSLTLVVGLFFSSVGLVFGVQAPGLTTGASGRYNVSFAGSGTSLGAQAGNVTEINLAGTQVTTHWAGFYGNITGNITLQDANGNLFYDWSGMGVPSGEVYASNTSTVSWSTIACANAANMTSTNTFLGMTGSNSDSVFNTYDAQSHGGFSVAGVSISADSCNSTNAYTNTGVNASYFQQVLLSDNRNIPVFATIINASATSFRSTAVDFQLLTGVPGTGTLYFFIELG